MTFVYLSYIVFVYTLRPSDDALIELHHSPSFGRRYCRFGSTGGLSSCFSRASCIPQNSVMAVNRPTTTAWKERIVPRTPWKWPAARRVWWRTCARAREFRSWKVQQREGYPGGPARLRVVAAGKKLGTRRRIRGPRIFVNDLSKEERSIDSTTLGPDPSTESGSKRLLGS